MKLFSTFFKKTIDNETKFNYNKQNEISVRQINQVFLLSYLVIIVVYGKEHNCSNKAILSSVYSET